MQTAVPESYSTISRRPLDAEDYIDILRRHKAWILGPAFAATVIAVVVAFLWPDTFVSSATIRVVPPLVPENYVATNINSEMSQRINSMYQTISSRSNLTNLIQSLGLYPRERQRMPIDDVVELMRSSIKLTDVVPIAATQRTRQHISAFQVLFFYENRFLAQRVTSELVGRFMSENQRERTSQSIQTTQFLKDQLDSAKKDLDAIEEKLASFRTTFAGRLPEQVVSNQGLLNNLEQRISNLNAQISRASQEKMLWESDLRSFKNQKAGMVPAPEQATQQEKNNELITIDRRLQALQAQMEVLRERYRESYPEVRNLQAEINSQVRLKEKLLQQDEKATSQTSKPIRRSDPAFERESRQLDAAIDRVQAQLKTKDSEIDSYKQQVAETEKQVRAIQSRLASAPMSEQQYAEVVRDREVARTKYEDLNKKRATSAIAEELEKRNQGETLELLDAASLPAEPVKPKRPMIVGGGLVLGLVLGFVLAGAREAKDSCLKNLKDVRAYTQLTVLGSIPLLENDLVVQRRKRLAWLAWSTGCLVGVVIMTGAVFYYYVTKV